MKTTIRAGASAPALGRKPLMPETDVTLTLDEIVGLRMALIFGVPDPEPDVIASVRAKLNTAERAIASYEQREAPEGGNR